MQEEEENEVFTSRNRMQENRMLAIQYMKNILNYQKNEALIKKENAENDCNQVEGITYVSGYHGSKWSYADRISKNGRLVE